MLLLGLCVSGVLSIHFKSIGPLILTLFGNHKLNHVNYEAARCSVFTFWERCQHRV